MAGATAPAVLSQAVPSAGGTAQCRRCGKDSLHAESRQPFARFLHEGL
jgi:hypothetical protein